MDKEDAIHIYNRILLNDKKKEIMPFAANGCNYRLSY